MATEAGHPGRVRVRVHRPEVRGGRVRFSWDQDADGIVHVAWYYIDLSVSNAGDWVRYTRSTDGGLTWDTPRTIA